MFCDFSMTGYPLSLKTDVKVPSAKKLREILIFSWHLESHWQAGSVVQCTPRDPYQNVTDTEHWLPVCGFLIEVCESITESCRVSEPFFEPGYYGN